MSQMADPMEALASYQRATEDGMPADLAVQGGSYLKQSGEIAGTRRFDYVKIVGSEVQALAMFVEDEAFNGITRFCLAYAVKKNHRGRGLAVEAITIGLKDLATQLGRAGVKKFYVEALIDRNNGPSIHVAKQVFPGEGHETIDEETGTEALLFYRLFEN